MAEGDREAVLLESAPRIAVYTPPESPPWADAVTLVLEYAGIPYEQIWDAEVLEGRLGDYDWLHLHHEDFTGQYSKFYLSFAATPWLREEVRRNERDGRALRLPRRPRAQAGGGRGDPLLRRGGGFLFAMCSATETLDLALASHATDISAAYANGRPPDPTPRPSWTGAGPSPSRMPRWSVVGGERLLRHRHPPGEHPPAHSPRGLRPLRFSARVDPVAAMLVQNHEGVIPDFYGLTTAFREERLKPGATILAREGNRVKYVHGTAGEGTWTFYGGHDPEDPEHQVGDAPRTWSSTRTPRGTG
jgi:hypothetical protein